MRKFAVLFIFLTISSCAGSNNWYPYNSNADLESSTELYRSNLKFVFGPDERRINKTYGIFIGIDNNSVKYLLLAPRRSLGISTSTNPFKYFNIDYGAALSISDTEKLITFLKYCEQLSDTTTNIDEAEYISYKHVPEIYYIQPLTGQEIKEEDIKFSFQLNHDGHESYCLLGQRGCKLNIR